MRGVSARFNFSARQGFDNAVYLELSPRALVSLRMDSKTNGDISMKKISYVLAFIVGFTVFSAPGLSFGKEFLFGVYTDDKASDVFLEFKPIAEEIERQLKTQGQEAKVTLKIIPSYDQAITELAEGKLDFSRFGPAPYVLCKKKNPNVKIIAMEQEKGKKTFKGLFITNTKTGLKSLKEVLKHRGEYRFAFGEDNSTIGRYLAQATLVKKGIFHTDFKSTEYLGRHDKVALAVIAGEYDLGVVKKGTFEKYKDKGLINLEDFANVTKPWIAKEGMDPKDYTALKKALLAIKDGSPALENLKINGFVDGSDTDYAPIRKGMELSEKFWAKESKPVAGR